MIVRYTIFFTAIICLPASATIIDVPADYSTIQEGIDASSDGDTVLVEPGEYVENINFNGHNIVLGSLFLTTGDISYILQTIIDGDDNGRVVTFESGEDSTAVITGFTIQNGYAENGGGIGLDLADASINQNAIKRNSASGQGGGIYSSRSYAKISNNFIAYNSAWSGGGIDCGLYRNVIDNNTIYWNTVYGTGGGISTGGNGTIISDNIIQENRLIGDYVSGGGGIFGVGDSTVISNNLIIGNEVEVGWDYGYSNGGGIHLLFETSNIILANNVICYNKVYDRGGGIFCGYASESSIINNTIFGNVVHGAYYYEHGGGLYCEGGSYTIISNTILWNNEANEGPQVFGAPQMSFSDIQGGWEGEGNIDADPLFRDPESGDFHLMSTACSDPYNSPCIDAGSPAIIDSLLDCSWGLGELRSDMGAYGGGDSATVGITDQPPRVPDRFALLQNYPNPFNARTVIRYSLPSDSDVTIEIFDILGRRVETLVSEKKQAGYHQVVWDAGDASSGVYFYKIMTLDHSEARRMILIK